jgi:hypothetical protein
MKLLRLGSALAVMALLAACGGGGGGEGFTCEQQQPADPCQDLGYGPAVPELADTWDYVLAGNPGTMTLFANGTMVDWYGGRCLPGFWGLSEGGTLTVTYSLSTECPPIGTVMTAEGVTAASTSLSGTVISSPIAGLAGETWSLSRE